VSRLPELTDKVDAFFARVEERHPTDLQCRNGCHDCCHVRLTITRVEASAIRDEISTWDRERRAALAANVAVSQDRCAALGPDGRCMIYAARPIVCRSHGVPIRMRNPLPVIQSCFRNFTARGPAAADPDCILDQETISTLLLAVDRAEGGGPRVDLAALLAEVTAG
jgi:hypothetical protein